MDAALVKTPELHILIIFFNNEFSLAKLGPDLPKKLEGHSMISMNEENLIILGGSSPNGGLQKAIYTLTCKSGLCTWTTMKQKLKVAREGFVAVPLTDSLASSCN